MLYSDVHSLREKLSGKTYKNNLAGDPWTYETDQHNLFLFTKIPKADEENGVVAYFKQFGIVGMVYVNDEELTDEQKAIVYSLAKKLGCTPRKLRGFM